LQEGFAGFIGRELSIEYVHAVHSDYDLITFMCECQQQQNRQEFLPVRVKY
jgi:hypothetical protein